jgi:adenylosuccinate lyase
VGLENLTGVARLLRGYLHPALEDIALWHERDISHSSVERVILPDATTLAHYALSGLRGSWGAWWVLEANLEKNLNLTRGLIYSQQVLNAPHRPRPPPGPGLRHRPAQRLKSWEEKQPFAELLEEDPENPLKGEALKALFDPVPFLRHVDAIYARFGL